MTSFFIVPSILPDRGQTRRTRLDYNFMQKVLLVAWSCYHMQISWLQESFVRTEDMNRVGIHCFTCYTGTKEGYAPYLRSYKYNGMVYRPKNVVLIYCRCPSFNSSYDDVSGWCFLWQWCKYESCSCDRWLWVIGLWCGNKMDLWEWSCQPGRIIGIARDSSLVLSQIICGIILLGRDCRLTGWVTCSSCS